MRRAVRAARTLAIAVWSSAAAARAGMIDHVPATSATPPQAGAAASAPFGADDLMLFEARAAGVQLSDAFEGYASRSGVYLPLGALARLLDLAVVAVPHERRAEGWVLSKERVVSLDLRTGTAVAGGKTFGVSPDEATVYQDDIWVRVDLAKKLLPVDIKADLPSLTLILTPREPLPFQQRADRDARRKLLDEGGGKSAEAVMKVKTPYAAFTPPSLDLDVNTAISNVQADRLAQYTLRAAGDLAFAGLQLYASSDNNGHLTSVRTLLERSDPDGQALGLLGGTRVDLGDAYTPSLMLGERSIGGRGFSYTNAPLEQGEVSSRVDVRGELPVGYEVELYVNDVLRGSQSTPVDGQYDFLQVPLAYGVNVVRLVFYGPQGQKREEVRRINFDGGRLGKGKLVVRFGAVQQDVNVIQPIAPTAAATIAVTTPVSSISPTLATTPSSTVSSPLGGAGATRIAGSVDYGMTNDLTLSSGFAQYTPSIGAQRQVATVGARTSVVGFAVQADAAIDQTKGGAYSLAATGRPYGVAVYLRDAEYSGGFYDELQPAEASGAQALSRSTELRLDAAARVFATGYTLPLSLYFRRDQAVDGGVQITADARTSASVQRWLVSTSATLQTSDMPGSPSTTRLTGAAEASGALTSVWRARYGAGWQLGEDGRLSSIYAELDRETPGRNVLRLTAAESFGPRGEALFQAAHTWKLAAEDITLATGYGTLKGDFRLGLEISVGAIFDPLAHRYRPARPGAAASGALAVDAFVDGNGDGAPAAGDAKRAGLVFEGGDKPVTTDAQGRAVITGVGDGALARVHLQADSITDPYLTAPAQTIAFVPRPGRVTQVEFPLAALGEVEVRVVLDKTSPARGVSAVQVQLLKPDGAVAASGTTEYDGTLILEGLRPGEYRVALDPDQAKRLNLVLAESRTVKIASGGGDAGRVTVPIRLSH